jgi:hypothetical protein
MCTAIEMLHRWQAFNVTSTAGAVMVEQKADVLQLNKEELYDKGHDSSGVQLLPYADAAKTRGYAEMKHQMNPSPGYGIPDLYLTGSLQSKMDLSVEGENYTIFSEDSKAPKLIKKYGKIFGLTTEGKKMAWSNIMRVPFVYGLAEQTGCNVG